MANCSRLSCPVYGILLCQPEQTKSHLCTEKWVQLKQIPESVEVALELGNGERLEFQVYARKSLDRLVERNINIKDHSAEISERNKQHDFGNWQKVDPSYKVAKNLAEFYSRVLWKAELMSDEIEYLAEEISKQS